ncbi:MAG: c-type cytochrome [Candidatus Binatia bacterium]
MNRLYLRLVNFLVPMLAWTVSASLAADAIPRGKAVYEAHCAVCHGVAGDGNGPEAHRFFTRPSDLTRASFKFRSTPSGSLPTDQDLERTIRRGLPASGMVAQEHLSDTEIRDVIAYIKTLSPRWVESTPSKPISIVPPKNLASLLAKGKDLFKKAGCPECHGPGGRGDGPSAGTLTSGGRPTRPADLTRRPFKGGDRSEDIYRALAVGIDGTPMPSYRDALEEEEIWALAVYVTRLATPGARPLPTDDERIGREVEAKHQPKRSRR